MDRKQGRLVLLGALPILGISAVIIGIGLGGRLPGFVGEVFRMVSGVMFTPVFLELSFAFLGLTALFWVNHLRLRREGDDYVSLEIEDDQDDSRS